MFVSLKITKSKDDILVAICDYELLNKTIRDGIKKIKISSAFYGDHKIHVDDKECIESLLSATMTNLIGKNIIQKALDLKIIHKNAIIWIGDVPHAQSIKC
ncbi:MAG: DUF424 domain-containing protein [Candidatus Helarchaeota archaeon]